MSFKSFCQCYYGKKLSELQSNLSEGVTQGKAKKGLLKTGDSLIQVHLHYILVQGTQERWLLETGDPLIEVTTQAGLTVYFLLIWRM